jgi:hypothetical protein
VACFRIILNYVGRFGSSLHSSLSCRYELIGSVFGCRDVYINPHNIEAAVEIIRFHDWTLIHAAVFILVL